jgi:glycosyltransferase involved in cell wall biosynthesis
MPAVAGIARIVARSLPRGVRPRTIYTEHLPWGGYVLPTRILNRLTYSLDDATIVVSHAVSESLPLGRRLSSRVLVHGVPIERVQAFRGDRDEMRRRLGVTDRQLVVGTVANLRKQKRYPDLLRAARSVIDAGLPVSFVAVGQGPEDETIRELHTDLGLGERFRLLGYHPEPARLLAACDVFVLASEYEGLPVAVMEALALGLPVVATDVPGTREAVRDGKEAVLVPSGRPELLGDALIRVLSDHDLREEMARAAAQRALKFDLARSVREIEEIYRGVAERIQPRQRMPRTRSITMRSDG